MQGREVGTSPYEGAPTHGTRRPATTGTNHPMFVG